MCAMVSLGIDANGEIISCGGSPLFFIYDEKFEIKPCSNQTYIKFRSKDNMIIKKNHVDFFGDNIEVSSIFLGLNHNIFDGAPIVWETLLRSEFDFTNERWNFSTHKDLMRHHERVLVAIGDAIKASKNKAEAIHKLNENLRRIQKGAYRRY
jgi:hypothetical protein